MSAAMVIVRAVAKRYPGGDGGIWALRDVSLEVHAGEVVCLMGPSGSGKSTLLNLIAGLDTPTSGDVSVDGQCLSDLTDAALCRLRRQRIALVFQSLNLMSSLTAAQNVAIPLRADRRPRLEVRRRVADALDAVGLTMRAGHRPHELSGGEMQRVAIARALATDAAIVLADEPTGSLDVARGEQVLSMLRALARDRGRAVVLVTHDPRAAAWADRTITLCDGYVLTARVGIAPSEPVLA